MNGRNTYIPSVKWSESEVAQLWPTLCDPMNCSPPGSSVYGILQARVLEWAAISFAKGYSQPRDWTQVSHIADFTIWATKEIQKSVGKYRETKHIRRGNDKLYMSMENSITVFPIKNTSRQEWIRNLGFNETKIYLFWLWWTNMIVFN